MESQHWNTITTGGRGVIEIVPVLVVHDASEFGSEVANRIQGELRSALGGAVCRENVGDALDGAKRFFAPGFRQTLQTPLWENQPVWTIWCTHGESELPRVLEKLAEMNQAFPRKFRHFLISLLPSESSSEMVSGSEFAMDVEESFTHTLLFSEDRLSHGITLSAVEGAAAVFRISWERYCEHRDGNISAAFHLSRDQKFFTIGSSICKPDTKFHSPRIANEIATTLSSRMLLPGSGQSPPETEDLRHKTGSYLDGSPVDVFPEPDSETGLGISNIEETIHLEYLAEARLRLSRSGNQRTQWHDDFQRLRGLRQTFSLLIQPNLEKRASDHTDEIANRQKDKLISYLALPDSPDGLYGVLQSRLNLVGDQLDFASATQVDEPGIPKDFRTDEKRLYQSISSIPERASLWLRAALFLVGFAWFPLGALLFTEKIPGPFDADLFPIVVATGSLMVAIPIGIFLRYFFVQARAIRRFDTALSNIHARHLWGLSRHIADLIRGTAESLQRKFGRQGTSEGAQAEIEAIRETLQEIKDSDTDPPKENQAPFFSPTGVSLCMKPHLNRWTEKAWGYFRNDLEKQFPDRDTLWPSATDWDHCLKNAAHIVAREGLESIPIDEFARTCNGDPAQRIRLFHDHSEEACTPCCSGIIPVDYAKIFVGPGDWYQYRGNHDDWELHSSLDPTARFITIMPINRTNTLSELCTS